MIPNFRPKIFCHLGQMLCLELEPITSSYFLLPFSKHLFSLVHGTKTERFKNYTFEKNYRFETVFESLHFHRTLYQIKYGFSQFRRSSNLWRNSESETFSKIVLRESYRIAFQSSQQWEMDGQYVEKCCIGLCNLKIFTWHKTYHHGIGQISKQNKAMQTAFIWCISVYIANTC